MPSKLSSSQTFVLGLAAVVALYFLLQRKLPPFEMGDHGSIVLAQKQSGREATGPTIDGCPVFPASNVWNTPIDALPKDPRSAAYLEVMRPISRLHPDFGTDSSYGIPFTVVPPTTRRIPIDFEYHDDSDLGNYPIPPDAPIEGGAHPKDDGDRHVIVIEAQRCMLYELFSAKKLSDGKWKAASGIRMDLESNSLRPLDKTSADAAGLPILPGLVRYEEVASGEIRHALRFTTTRTQAAYVWPARHFASPHRDANFPPMGERFRLRADFDASGYPAADKVIITALKKYGMLLADNGGDMFISGVPDKRWNDDELHKLTNIKASDFEAVDETSLQMLDDSARADPLSASTR
ncbi:hypothetical protein Terro_2814 [Terriglobus roseus DSM 18391]|uniref:Uncharacterized protein n=1 Tax=Terriglobus roseus (strain DSM 18391 / NRRL B-41598 / KBS 63) TaxID=926566 RepID=I3ZII2_TERRK|nr:hypothetical protein [Terriglobus roseus]AFL89050.1 hypothetical protein Terro_2814 [Terriglobus roseus DSM 18391]